MHRVAITFTLIKMFMLPFLKQVCRLAIIIFFVIVSLRNLSAQQATPVPFPLLQENIFIKEYGTYTLSKKSIGDFTTISSYNFSPLQAFGSSNSLQLSDTVESGWIYFSIENKLSTDTFLILKIQSSERVILYKQQRSELQETGRTGWAMPASQLSIDKDTRRIKILLKAGAKQQFLFRQQRYGLSAWLNIPQLQTYHQTLIEQKDENKFNLLRERFTFLNVGFYIAIFFFSVVKYNSQHKNKSYLWYGIAGLLVCFFLLIERYLIILDSPLWNNLNQWDYFLLFSTIAGLAYLKFQVQILQLRQHQPKLITILKVYAIVLSTGILAGLICNQLSVFPIVAIATRIFSNVAGLIIIAVFLIYLRNKRTGFYKYIFYGLACWIAGFCIYIPYLWFGLKKYLPPFVNGDVIMGTTQAVEVLFFLKALMYKDNETEREKIHFQQQSIEQLEQNKTLQQTFTADLEKQVQDRTTEVLEQRKIIEQERENKLTADFKRRFSESELKALRSQINPHFIFNVLNTIESFALENNAEAASDMIQKFSRLTRLVLENSLYHVVSVADDLEALQLYIELEQVRCQGKFEANIIIGKEVLEGNYAIPPMIIQPYVENAILHGLRNLAGKGILRIHAGLNTSFLIITIEDNGIGRVKAATLKQNEIIKRTSVGMSLTQDRISLFNNLVTDNKAVVLIHDLEQGTRVELKFPLSF